LKCCSTPATACWWRRPPTGARGGPAK
jgi:hypothetical protein